jgi:hypothetical protein
VADYKSGARERPDVIEKLRCEIERWRNVWCQDKAPPILGVSPIDKTTYLLIDTRRVTDGNSIRFLSKEQAMQVLSDHRLQDVCVQKFNWALDMGLLVELDGYLVSLVTAPFGVLESHDIGIGKYHSESMPADKKPRSIA